MDNVVVANHRDPLLRDAVFPHSGLFFPYGFPVRLHTNTPEILEAAEESWGLYEPYFPQSPPLELHVGIAGEEAGLLPPPPVVRSMRHLLTIVGDAEHAVICDFDAGYAHCWLTPRILKDRSALRFFYLDAMAYSMVCERYLTGIHGSSVAWNDSGVLLCGDSEAGKSTLAYACARRGFTYISDDGSFLLRDASDRIVTGNPHLIRFRPSAVELFPELSDFVPVLRANGKLSIEIPTSRLPMPSIASRCRVDALVFLHRRPGAKAHLLPFPREEALRQFQSVLTYGRDSARQEQRASLQRLLSANVWELIYSDLDSAVNLLEHLPREEPCL